MLVSVGEERRKTKLAGAGRCVTGRDSVGDAVLTTGRLVLGAEGETASDGLVRTLGMVGVMCAVFGVCKGIALVRHWEQHTILLLPPPLPPLPPNSASVTDDTPSCAVFVCISWKSWSILVRCFAGFDCEAECPAQLCSRRDDVPILTRHSVGVIEIDPTICLVVTTQYREALVEPTARG